MTTPNGNVATLLEMIQELQERVAALEAAAKNPPSEGVISKEGR